jgi:hypothetical protein
MKADKLLFWFWGLTDDELSNHSFTTDERNSVRDAQAEAQRLTNSTMMAGRSWQIPIPVTPSVQSNKLQPNDVLVLNMEPANREFTLYTLLGQSIAKLTLPTELPDDWSYPERIECVVQKVEQHEILVEVRTL